MVDEVVKKLNEELTKTKDLMGVLVEKKVGCYVISVGEVALRSTFSDRELAEVDADVIRKAIKGKEKKRNLLILQPN